MVTDCVIDVLVLVVLVEVVLEVLELVLVVLVEVLLEVDELVVVPESEQAYVSNFMSRLPVSDTLHVPALLTIASPGR